jgi:ABC-type branched-subunit amino acid transport system ATPase component
MSHIASSETGSSQLDAIPERLSVRRVVKRFGGVAALAGVDLTLKAKEILGLIGPNGSGKTTLVNCISGVLPITSGTIWLDEREITRWSRVRRAKSGIARTFQNLQLFRELTVSENIAVGANSASSMADRDKTVEELMVRLGLENLARAVVSEIPHGRQRRVELARALAGSPKVLLVDEPAAGLNDAETAELRSLLVQVREDFGCSILLIDHDMSLVLKVADRVQVLDEGRVIFIGPPDQAFRQQNVVEAYLGTNLGQPA